MADEQDLPRLVDTGICAFKKLAPVSRFTAESLGFRAIAVNILRPDSELDRCSCAELGMGHAD
jgi:hypothetical protein